MNKSNLKIPAKFESESFLSELNRLNQKYNSNHICIDETYGSIPLTVIGNARPAVDLAQINFGSLSEYISESDKYGISFNYTMNSVWSAGKEFTENGKKSILQEIENLMRCGVKNVSISSPGIIKLVRNYFPELAVSISINSCVDSIYAIKRWEKENVEKIILNRHINRDFDLLQAMQKQSQVKLELLVNSMCNVHCSLHQYHNIINSCRSNLGETDFKTNYPQNQCTYNILDNLMEVMCCSWIRPEDLCIYEDMGFSSFKLDGRCLKTEDVLFCVESYLDRRLDGNFFDIFDFFNFRQDHAFSMFLNNRELDGFVKTIKESRLNCRTCGGNNTYCKKLADQIQFSDKRIVKTYKNILKKSLKETGL